MKVPETPAQAMPKADLPSPTMFAMAAAIMDQQGKLRSDPYEEPPQPTQNQLEKRGMEIRREMEDAGMNKKDPRGVPLGPGNEHVPGNRGLLQPWNRRT